VVGTYSQIASLVQVLNFVRFVLVFTRNATRHPCSRVYSSFLVSQTAPASFRCRDCSPGGSFFCSSCSETTHDAGCRPHRIDSLDPSTFGFEAVSPPQRILRSSHCSYCKTSLLADDAGEEEASFKVTLVTARTGPVMAVVKPFRCDACGCLSGTTAPEYFCISGGDAHWVEQELLDERRDVYFASHYSLSSASMAGAYERRSSERGWSGDSRRVLQFAVERAGRVYDAILRKQAESGEDLCQIDLRECPACSGAQGIRGILHCDGCFKFKQRDHASSVHGAPLSRSIFGVSLTPAWGLKNEQFEKFRFWRINTLKIPTSKQDPAPSNCPDLRSVSAQKASSKNLSVTGLHMGVCRHNISNHRVALVIDTPGEGTEYAHFTIRRLLHDSGQVALETVFGPIPTPPKPPLNLIHSDIPCQLLPHLKKFDPEAYQNVAIKLGEVHKYNHKCQLANSARYAAGAAMGSGEQCEPFWAKIEGAAPSAEHSSSARFHELATQATELENQMAMSQTPALLSRMEARSYDRFSASADLLDKILLQIYTSTGEIVDASKIAEWKLDLCEMSGSSRSEISRLSLRAQVCATVEERGALIVLLDAYSDMQAQGVGNQSTEEQIDQLTKKVKRFDSTLQRLLRDDTTGRGEPTASERLEVRAQRRTLIKLEISEQQALVHALDGSFKRGYNHHNHHIYNSDKAGARKRIERAKKRIEFLNRQLAIISAGDFEADTDEPICGVIPELLKLSALDALETCLRCYEELVVQLPEELKGYIDKCESDACALEKGALELQECARSTISVNSQVAMGQATALLTQANVRRSWAVGASTVGSLGVPSFEDQSVAVDVLNEAIAKTPTCHLSTSGNMSGSSTASGTTNTTTQIGTTNRVSSSSGSGSTATATSSASDLATNLATNSTCSSNSSSSASTSTSTSSTSTSSTTLTNTTFTTCSTLNSISRRQDNCSCAVSGSGSACYGSNCRFLLELEPNHQQIRRNNQDRLFHCAARGVSVLQSLAGVQLRTDPRSYIESLLAPLDTDETDTWRKAFSVDRFSAREVVHYPGGSHGSLVCVLDKDFWRLQPQKWVNDEAVNAYLYILQKWAENHVSEYGQSLFLSTHFWEQLSTTVGFSSDCSWFRNVDLFSLNFVYIPVNVTDTHWYPVIVDVKKKRICCYDSYGHEDRSTTLERIRLFFVAISAPIMSSSISSESPWVSEATVIYKEGGLVTPQQSNSYDCGIFMLTVFKFHSRGLPLLFSEAYMNVLRGRITLELLQLPKASSSLAK